MASISPKKNPSVHIDRPALDDVDLTGQRAAVVGGTGGLGRGIARRLADRGAQVTVVGQTFRDADTPRIEFLRADLSLMSEAARVADELPAEQLDLLVLTTGIMAAPEREQTPEGLERDMAVSYLSRLVLLRRLADRLGTARPTTSRRPRVFIMGFPGVGATIDLDDINAEKSYKNMAVHFGTVAGNEALVVDSAAKYPGLSVFGLNPGFVGTNIRSNMYGKRSVISSITEGLTKLLAPSADQYAARVVPALLSPTLDGKSGLMIGSKGQAILASADATATRSAEIIDRSIDLVRRVAPDTVWGAGRDSREVER